MRSEEENGVTDSGAKWARGSTSWSPRRSRWPSFIPALAVSAPVRKSSILFNSEFRSSPGKERLGEAKGGRRGRARGRDEDRAMDLPRPFPGQHWMTARLKYFSSTFLSQSREKETDQPSALQSEMSGAPFSENFVVPWQAAPLNRLPTL